jgi:hypothetical protein
VIPIIRTRILEKVLLKILNLRNGLELKSVTVIQLRNPGDYKYQIMKRNFTETPKIHVLCDLPMNEKKKITGQIKKLSYEFIIHTIGRRIGRKDEIFFLVYLDF